ncbi:hypothetical protein BDQ12DRAFT_684001 [Crucibulum laeve]|uniref:Uncharacterized protein n=1 Tax=Crucibulum laeve TaxID=68775 RepID=A0A5C3MAE4_9AGAR|nr:hypothetical protein BDQ12DRAFT_684001 [Crucibulum laeve]
MVTLRVLPSYRMCPTASHSRSSPLPSALPYVLICAPANLEACQLFAPWLSVPLGYLALSRRPFSRSICKKHRKVVTPMTEPPTMRCPIEILIYTCFSTVNSSSTKSRKGLLNSVLAADFERLDGRQSVVLTAALNSPRGPFHDPNMRNTLCLAISSIVHSTGSLGLGAAIVPLLSVSHSFC